jgi:hypothetical protein
MRPIPVLELRCLWEFWPEEIGDSTTGTDETMLKAQFVCGLAIDATTRMIRASLDRRCSYGQPSTAANNLTKLCDLEERCLAEWPTDQFQANGQSVACEAGGN